MPNPSPLLSEKVVPVPTLTLDGWVTSGINKADYLIAHFFESEKSQTSLYGNSVASLQWVIQNNQGDIILTCQAIRETLSEYFSKYFSNVNITVTHKQDPPESSQYLVSIYLSFVDDKGQNHTLDRVFTLLNSKFKLVTDLNNIGSLA